MAKNDEVIDVIARILAELITGDTRNMPAAFLVYAEDIRPLLALREKARRAIKDPDRPRISHEVIDRVITRVWDECRVLTQTNMTMIEEALSLAERVEKEKEDSATPEWINAY